MKIKRTHFFSPAFLIAMSIMGVINSNAQSPATKKIKFVGIHASLIGVNVNNQLKLYKSDENHVWSDSKMRFAIPANTEDIFSYTGEGTWSAALYLATYEKGFVTTWEADGKGKWRIKPGPDNTIELIDGFDRLQYNGWQICAFIKNNLDFYTPKGDPYTWGHFIAPQECQDLFMIGTDNIAVRNNSNVTFYSWDKNDEKWIVNSQLQFTLPADCKGLLPFNNSACFGVIKDKTIDIYFVFETFVKLVSTFTIPN